MAGTPDGLDALIQSKLDEITLSEEVIQKLVARGIPRTSAQRFVDRALVENPPSWTPSRPVPSEPPSAESPSLTDYLRKTEPVADVRAHKDLTRGGIAMAAGIALTLLSFAIPGGARLMYGLALYGLWLFGRGVVRSARREGPFPWKRMLLSAAIPATIVAAFVGLIGWALIQRERRDQRLADAALANADASRAEQVRAESNAKREIDNRARAARQEARLDQALKDLTSDRPMTQCDATLVLSRSGSREHVPALVHLLTFADSNAVRSCAVSALVDLGDTGTALATYTRWAEGADHDLRRSALIGFGEIGPSAAHIALPHLSEALKSPRWDQRYVAVESLAKLGPTAVPLLQVAAGDADSNVRDLAASALAGKK